MRVINDGRPPKSINIETFKLLALVRYAPKPVKSKDLFSLWERAWDEKIDGRKLWRIVERALALGLIHLSVQKFKPKKWLRYSISLTLVGKRSVDERRRLGELRALRQGSGRE